MYKRIKVQGLSLDKVVISFNLLKQSFRFHCGQMYVALKQSDIFQWYVF